MSSGIKRFFLFLFVFCTVFSSLSTSVSADNFAVDAFGSLGESKCDGIKYNDVNVSSRFYELLFGNKNKSAPDYLIVGGDTFGIKIREDYITVSEVSGSSAFRTGDKILSVGGKKIECAEDINDALKESGGRTVNVEIIREGERLTLTVIPKLEDGIYKLGIKLKRFTSGIGTVTFIDPETHLFGGLGHGVYESDGGSIVNIKDGICCDVILGGLKRGEVGRPGELSGILSKNVTGNIFKNTECGVFGVFENIADSSLVLPVGTRSDVKVGEAEIVSTVKSGKKAHYKIEITEINEDSQGSKSFKIRVTDGTLIAISGGIVRGMSGSPIIQNGKLVGAVTHVMVANPTEGYGIFIENMLNAAHGDVVPKAA